MRVAQEAVTGWESMGEDVGNHGRFMPTSSEILESKTGITLIRLDSV
jgi:hypothetical protein